MPPMMSARALLLAPVAVGPCRLRREPGPRTAAPPPPAVTVAKPTSQTVTDYDEYVGRFVALEFGRSAGPRFGLPRPDTFHRRSDGQAGRSAVHHRRAALPQCPRAGEGQSRVGARQSRVHRSRSRSRLPARARQDDHPADLRSAHPGQARRRSARRGAGSCGRAGCARSRIHRIARAESTAASAIAAFRRAISSPAAPPATRRCSPPSCRSIRSASSSRSTRRPICVTSALAEARRGHGQPRQASVPVSLKLIDEHGIHAPGLYGFRRQRDRPRVRHDPRPRRVFQSERRFHARHVRAHPHSRLRRRIRRCWCRMRRSAPSRSRKFVYVVDADGTVRQKYRDARARLSATLRVIKDGLDRDDRVIVNGLMRARPGQKVTPQEAGCSRRPYSRRRRAADATPAKTN